MLVCFVTSYPIDNEQPTVAITYPTTSTVSLTDVSNVTSSPSTTTSCNLTDPTFQEYGMCWDLSSQQLQISPNLSPDNFVRFYKSNFYNPFVKMPIYTKQVCDQSQRFNSIGILCVSNQLDCSNGLTTAMTCDYKGECICVVGERYRAIADAIVPANQPAVQPTYQNDWSSVQPNANTYNEIPGDLESNKAPASKPSHYQRGNHVGWSARLTQKIRNLFTERFDSSGLFDWWSE